MTNSCQNLVTNLVLHLVFNLINLVSHLVTFGKFGVTFSDQFSLTFGDDFGLIFGSHSVLNLLSGQLALKSNCLEEQVIFVA